MLKIISLKKKNNSKGLKETREFISSLYWNIPEIDASGMAGSRSSAISSG